MRTSFHNLKPLLSLACGLLMLLLAACNSNPNRHSGPPTAQEEHGQRIFRTVCATCHRIDSDQPLNGPSLRNLYGKKYLPSGAPVNDERIRETLIRGRKNMPPYGNIYGDEQLNDIIAYLKTL